MEYMPFGTIREKTGSLDMDHRYTDKEYDAETGLYYYGARYYDPMIARFVMADTVVPDITDTQALNPYAYCLNNPLIHIDPTGHYSKKVGNVGAGAALSGIPWWAVSMINFGVGVAVGVGGLLSAVGVPSPAAFALSIFASGILTGKLSGQSWGATLANAGINAGFALAGFGAGFGTSFIISRFAYSHTSYTVAHVIAGLGAAAIFGGGAYPVYKAGGERWLSAYLSFAGGFDAGLAMGWVKNRYNNELGRLRSKYGGNIHGPYSKLKLAEEAISSREHALIYFNEGGLERALETMPQSSAQKADISSLLSKTYPNATKGRVFVIFCEENQETNLTQWYYGF